MRDSVVVCVSALVWLAILIAERAVGITWDFHPDALRYMYEYDAVVSAGVSGLPNNLYYFLSALLRGNGFALVALNGVFYIATNVILWRGYRSLGFEGRGAALTLGILVLGDGYRAHLSVHPLKDTAVIFLAVALTMGLHGKVASLVTMVLSRLASLIYLIALVAKRYAFAIGIAGIVVLFAVPELRDLVIARNTLDMGGRAFDTIPNFSDGGLAGAILRGFFWPVLLMSGGFVLLAPTPFFVPIAAYLLIQRSVAWRYDRTTGVTLATFVAIAGIAVFVTTYTSFVRYSAPLATLSVWLSMFESRGRSRTARPISRAVLSPGTSRASMEPGV